MVPQVPNLNRVTWKALEVWCRKEVTGEKHHAHDHLRRIRLHLDHRPGQGRRAGRSAGWKAVLENGQWSAWLMPNVATVDTKPFTTYAVPIAELDRKLGLKVEAIKP